MRKGGCVFGRRQRCCRYRFRLQAKGAAPIVPLFLGHVTRVRLPRRDEGGQRELAIDNPHLPRTSCCGRSGAFARWAATVVDHHIPCSLASADPRRAGRRSRLAWNSIAPGGVAALPPKQERSVCRRRSRFGDACCSSQVGVGGAVSRRSLLDAHRRLRRSVRVRDDGSLGPSSGGGGPRSCTRRRPSVASETAGASDGCRVSQPRSRSLIGGHEWRDRRSRQTPGALPDERRGRRQ